MARLGSWIEPFPEGIYVRPADAWIDPSRPQPRALVTHGHADHACGGSSEVYATPETLAIMDCRYGEQAGHPVGYGEVIRLGDVDVSFVPAGHVLGSAQIVLEHGGERIVVSGDYKRRPDPTCAPFEPVACDIFITEATFGLPVFRHPATTDEVDKLLARLADNPERCVLVGAYALGKAQRLIAELRARGHHEPIYIHGALQRLCDLYVELGRGAGRAAAGDGRKKDELKGRIVLAPPGALNDRWSRRLPDPITAMASGLDAGAPARAPAAGGDAADHLRSCRLGRAHHHHPGNRAQGSVDHPRPRGSADALVHDPPDQGPRAQPGRL
jgi:putative mRNA 3-end processing factor